MNGRRRILVVDKDQDMARLLNNTLKLEGFDTVIVADGDSALHLLDRLEPDVVILDENEPDDASLRFVDHIRRSSDVPIIVLTQAYEMDGLCRTLSHGADDYIRKPFGAKTFIARVRAKMRRTAARPA
jgi:DNA-binding response OmpR family regulator